VYVLVLVTITYLLNQVDRYLYSSEPPKFVTTHEFGQITGPLFTVTFTLAGVVISFIGSRWHKTLVLGMALIFWSVCTGLTGLCTKFWQVAIVRIGQSLGQAACNPFAAGLIAAYFPADVKATAMSIYNIGIYTGFSLAQSAGTKIAHDSHGSDPWRTPYFVFGFIGIGVAALLMVTAKDPTFVVSSKKSQLEGDSEQPLLKAGDVEESVGQQELQQHAAATAPSASLHASYKEIFWFWVTSPSLILLCVAGGVRNAGGYVWAYQVSNYFKKVRHVEPNDYAVFMLWIPLIGGSCGALFGGWVSDRIVNRVRADGTKMGPQGRLFVVMVSNIVAAPFAMAALLVEHSVPWGFLPLIGSNVFGEMWIGIVITVVLEMTPKNMHSTSVAIYMFIVTNIGGNAPLLVPYIQSLFHSDPLRNTLLILFPGTYVLSSVFFALILFFAGRDALRAHASA